MVGGITSGAALLFALEEQSGRVVRRTVRTCRGAVAAAAPSANTSARCADRVRPRDPDDVDVPAAARPPAVSVHAVPYGAVARGAGHVGGVAHRVVERVSRRSSRTPARERSRRAPPLGSRAPVVTFFWGNTELSHAYSADVSTFLLILYYAVGRRRGDLRRPRARDPSSPPRRPGAGDLRRAQGDRRSVVAGDRAPGRQLLARGRIPVGGGVLVPRAGIAESGAESAHERLSGLSTPSERQPVDDVVRHALARRPGHRSSAR